MTTWFERKLGFTEQNPEQVRANLELRDTTIVSRINGATLGCGRLETPSLSELRSLDNAAPPSPSTVREVVGESGALHRDPQNAGRVLLENIS